jgi:hypothetical protein
MFIRTSFDGFWIVILAAMAWGRTILDLCELDRPAMAVSIKGGTNEVCDCLGVQIPAELFFCR